MNRNTPTSSKPVIAIREADYGRLTALAQVTIDKDLAVGDELMAELERATVIVGEVAACRTIQMGSTTTYKTGTSEPRTVTLVYPGEADIEANRISVLTPIGVALLGLSKGQSISWIARDGTTHTLKVVSVGK
ncbi:nucleoside diphosphate kinase regulator [Rhizobium grahamii]|uniref:Nucleoside diphosphate kinase regulator n=2 Tax=Rhizobium grahamii TaxID=1120045 RepID=S3H756_9HYPH|nr:nucleoside diphosphate kinase regulator [Rhizobium grahamii]EPE94727.1 nucleoside diphosphate kinase regulator [Rhizobium grahamii CCGE 502]RDJ05527.1 nucleoside diphosphate kinase regulator [Rhizobium grahamii]